MNKNVFQIMSVIVAFALTFGSFTSAGAAPQMAATTYYVSTTGNDANAGTQTQPWKTLGKANNTAVAGDTIQVQAGTYDQVVVVKKSNLTWIANGKVITKAFEVEGNNNVVRGFTITDPLSKAGIRTTGNFNLIENNEIYHMLEDGIWFWGHDNTFRNNYMHDILAPSAESTNNGDPHVDCIMTWDWLWDTYNIVFEGNVCDNNRAVGSNQMIIVTGTRAHDMTFRSNRFIMRDAGYSPFALYGGSSYKIENNYFCNTTGQGSAALYLSGGTGITANNNVYGGYSVFAQGSGIVSQSGTVKDSSPCAVFPSSVPPVPTASSIPTATTVPASPTPTASSIPTATTIPASPTPAASSIPTASPVPASPTPTASSMPASPTAMPVQPSITPTASSSPVQPTATIAQPSATPIAATPTASAVPVLPTSTSVQPAATAQPQSPPASETKYDDKHASFVYSSDWRDVSLAQASGGSFKKTGQDGSSVTLTFTGQSFSIIYTSGTAYGKVNVYIDGQLVKTLDENGKTTGYQKRWDYPAQLTLGKHTLKLVTVGNGGAKSSLDAVIVR